MAHRIIQTLFLTILFMIFSPINYAESLTCKVDKIININEITCMGATRGDGVLIKNSIKFAQIDLVRAGQEPFFSNATKRLNELMADKLIVIDVKKILGRYKTFEGQEPPTVIGIVYIDNLNVNLRLVKEGLAVAAPSDEKINTIYHYAQTNANIMKLGLWSTEPVISPRQFDDNWQKWQRELPKVLAIHEVIECQVKDITYADQFNCYYKDKNNLNRQDYNNYKYNQIEVSAYAEYGSRTEASYLLKKLLANKKITMHVEQIDGDTIYIGSDIQRKRVVKAKVYIDGKNLAEEMLKEGLAATYPSKQWPENPTYIALQNKAMQEKKRNVGE